MGSIFPVHLVFLHEHALTSILPCYTKIDLKDHVQETAHTHIIFIGPLSVICAYAILSMFNL